MVMYHKCAQLCFTNWRGTNTTVSLITRSLQSSVCYMNMFKPGITNPLDDFKPFLQVPILVKKDWGFKPNYSDVEKVQNVFKKATGNSIVPLKGVANYQDLPELHVPEVAFIGRSNVGKSSLIKALFFNPSKTKISVSKSPGHTTVIKVYSLPRLFSLVDMPGYGHKMPTYFTDCVEAYLKNRRNLSRTFLLMDATSGITDIDKIGVEMMEEFGIPYTTVFTKIDKINLHKGYKVLKDFNDYRKECMPGCLPQPFLVSSKEDYGVSFLRAFIAHVTGHLNI